MIKPLKRRFPVAQWRTRFNWQSVRALQVRKMPTGLPDCTNRVSSSSRFPARSHGVKRLPEVLLARAAEDKAIRASAL